MRGSITYLIICLSSFVALPVFADPLDPQNVRLSWSDSDTNGTMTITWTTEFDDAATTVEYGIDSTEEFVLEGESFEANSGLGFIHYVELTELEPNTVYRYRVGGLGRWTEEEQFHTSPEPCTEPFRFIVMGDNRPDIPELPQPNWQPILEEAVGHEPAFIVHTGDIIMDGESTNQWNTFFDDSEPYLATQPLMPTLGNHDDGPGEGETANYNQLFSLPKNSVTETEDFYYFTYSDAIFVSISSQTATGGEIPFQTQADWLDQVLTDNPRTWKFVFLHHPPYASHRVFDLGITEFEFNHPPNENEQNAALVPVFDRHHVDMVFAGHNHYYERFQPLYGGAGNDQGNVVDDYSDGTIYVITGGAGAFTYDEYDIFGVEIDLIAWLCGEADGSSVCSGKHHYVIIEIDGPTLTYEAWATGQQLDGWDEDNIDLIESFEIVKDDDLCPEPEIEPVAEPTTPLEQPVEPMPDATIEIEEDAPIAQDSSDGPVEDGTGTGSQDGTSTPGPSQTGVNAADDGCGCLMVDRTSLWLPLLLLALGAVLGTIRRAPARLDDGRR